MYTRQVGRTTEESYGGRASDISRMHNAFLRGHFFGKPATTRYYIIIIISCNTPGIVRLLSDGVVRSASGFVNRTRPPPDDSSES